MTLGGADARVMVMSAVATSVRPLRRVEYDRLVSAGVFESERVELIDGTVMTMAPHGPEHDGTLQILAKLLARAVGERADVRVQSAFAAAEDAEPEPDLALVPPGDYRDAHPNVASLVVEVAVSSQLHDRRKAAVYARAGVTEYWIVDVPRGVIERHLAPSDMGYEQKSTLRRGESIAPHAFPDAVIAIDTILR